MDDTPKYIEMCEKAVEIQKEWKPSEGDFIIRSDITQESLNVVILKQLRDCKNFDRITVEAQVERNPLTWLPRQDQLQEMLEETLMGKRLRERNRFSWAYREHPEGWMATCILWEFSQWEDKVKGYRLFDSWEQLWLAFVMKEKYKKVWNETKKEWKEVRKMKKAVIILLVVALLAVSVLAVAAEVRKRELYPTGLCPEATGFVTITETMQPDGVWRTHMILQARGLPADTLFRVIYGGSFMGFFKSNYLNGSNSRTTNGSFTVQHEWQVDTPGGTVQVRFYQNGNILLTTI